MLTNIFLARPTWYLYLALSCVNICTELRCLCSVLTCLLLTYPPFPLLLEIVNWGPNIKAFQLQHLINEILTFQMQSVAALSTCKIWSNAHGVPRKSNVLLLLNLLGSLRNRNGSKIKWLHGFWAKLERKGIFCYCPLVCRALAFKQTKKECVLLSLYVLFFYSKCAEK